MQVRNWIESAFGEEKMNSLLDEEVYSEKEIKKDQMRLKKKRKDLSTEISEANSEYQKLVKKAAEASEAEQVPYVKRAKLAKKKYQLKNRQYQKNSALMATLVSVKGARELQGMTQEPDTQLEKLLNDDALDTSNIEDDMFDEMMQFGITMETMQEVQGAMDFEVMDPDVDTETDDEVMGDVEAVAAGNVDAEQLGPDQDEDAVGAAGVEDEFDEMDDQLL
jgi:hypothetical protein